MKDARKAMKSKLRNLESKWRENIIAECTEANDKGDSGAMYRALRKLETRNSKTNSGTTITSEQFKDHFQKVSAQRFENAPEANASQRGPNQNGERERETKRAALKFRNRTVHIENSNSAPGKDGIKSVFIKYAWS